MNTDLVIFSGGEAVASSLAIADGVNHSHKSVIRLVRDNQEDLADFGRVRFENAPLHTAGGIQYREVALLNEQQATLLMTYMRNSDVVKQFKRRLVACFFQLRGGVQVPQDFSAALRLAADQHDRAQALALQNQVLEEQLKDQSSKVAFHDAVTGGEGLYSVKEAAGLLGTGQNRLMADLRDLNWVDGLNRPYQRKLDAGLMDCKLSRYQHPVRGSQESVTAMITGNGLAKLQQLLADPCGEPGKPGAFCAPVGIAHGQEGPMHNGEEV